LKVKAPVSKKTLPPADKQRSFEATERTNRCCFLRIKGKWAGFE